MRLCGLEQRLSDSLDTPVIVVRAVAAIDRARLNRAERARLSGFPYAKRRRDWLLGRNALKEILAVLDRSDDTTSVTFPGSRVSLTHAADIALAAATPAAALGIGIDYEPLRRLDARAAHWFLNEEECDWLRLQPETTRAAHLVRLWTVKEAAFKSHPHNACMTLGEFAISNPAAAASRVFARGQCIDVSCHAFDSGFLSFAISGEIA